MPISTTQDLRATASTTIDAPRADVWAALTNPEAIKTYMFGTDVVSTWKEGSPITWSGEWQGRAYQDEGTIQRIEKDRLLRYTHFSPLSGQPDRPENHHLVSVELSDSEGGTRVVLTQDNNATKEARDHSEKNWATMLGALKAYVESRR